MKIDSTLSSDLFVYTYVCPCNFKRNEKSYYLLNPSLNTVGFEDSAGS